jgi:hypothetical protein
MIASLPVSPKPTFPALPSFFLYVIKKIHNSNLPLALYQKKNSYTLESGEGEIGLMFSDLERDIRL